VKLTRTVTFTVDMALAFDRAVAFVQDVRKSLGKAGFIRDLEVLEEAAGLRVRAGIPVSAALFGQHVLAFESWLRLEARGARLEGVRLAENLVKDKVGWAELSGEAEVTPLPSGSRVSYRIDVTIHLNLPEAKKWGAQALFKMVQYTANQVLTTISAEFPEAIAAAAGEHEAAYAL
jgi:hypothetical protein